jgi:hypothetical protein
MFSVTASFSCPCLRSRLGLLHQEGPRPARKLIAGHTQRHWIARRTSCAATGAAVCAFFSGGKVTRQEAAIDRASAPGVRVATRNRRTVSYPGWRVGGVGRLRWSVPVEVDQVATGVIEDCIQAAVRHS